MVHLALHTRAPVFWGAAAALTLAALCAGAWCAAPRPPVTTARPDLMEAGLCFDAGRIAPIQQAVERLATRHVTANGGLAGQLRVEWSEPAAMGHPWLQVTVRARSDGAEVDGVVQINAVTCDAWIERIAGVPADEWIAQLNDAEMAGGIVRPACVDARGLNAEFGAAARAHARAELGDEYRVLDTAVLRRDPGGAYEIALVGLPLSRTLAAGTLIPDPERPGECIAYIESIRVER